MALWWNRAFNLSFAILILSLAFFFFGLFTWLYPLMFLVSCCLLIVLGLYKKFKDKDYTNAFYVIFLMVLTSITLYSLLIFLNFDILDNLLLSFFVLVVINIIIGKLSKFLANKCVKRLPKAWLG
ncbi:MAG: hypothetical protein A3A97_04955 [Candidatus Terrybacteria bacterium RIFCSPLOWO2_01_FULL_40_23]|uniref:Uncharacterized protein n=1 Tax=Candidatus Terrybacteria bacterium RIFCSPLOWO2_01_FULL_40_23 TaxID=1802366 RepID=A0A1G2PV84_9BACT|nr:MAG: hypothetical protein A3A97_04955 [Candidatus Terrybacteria bacterium RIFCSPLOWO2_01_FULL_40_23]